MTIINRKIDLYFMLYVMLKTKLKNVIIIAIKSILLFLP
jgi:hypothetical protein